MLRDGLGIGLGVGVGAGVGEEVSAGVGVAVSVDVGVGVWDGVGVVSFATLAESYSTVAAKHADIARTKTIKNTHITTTLLDKVCFISHTASLVLIIFIKSLNQELPQTTNPTVSTSKKPMTPYGNGKQKMTILTHKVAVNSLVQKKGYGDSGDKGKALSERCREWRTSPFLFLTPLLFSVNT